MPPKILQILGTGLNGFVEVEPRHTAGRAGNKLVGFGKDYGRFVKLLHQSAGHYGHNPFVPRRIIDYRRFALLIALGFAHHLLCGAGNLPVHALSLVVVQIYGIAYLCSALFISGDKKVHCNPAALHSAGGIYSGTYLKDNVIYAYLVFVQAGELDYGFKPLSWLFVKPLQSIVCKYSVLSRHQYKVRCYCHNHKVQQGTYLFKGYVVLLRISLHKFKAHSASAEVVEGIVAPLQFRVQHSHRLRQGVIGKMMVTYDEIYAALLCIFYLVHSLYSAVKRYNERIAILQGIVHALVGDAVSLFISVRDIVVHPLCKTAYKGVEERHCSSAVHIIISVDKYSLSILYCRVKTLHRNVHLLHKEWVVEF